MSALIQELEEARRAAIQLPECKLCKHVDTMAHGIERESVIRAAAGTIGAARLAEIFHKHGIPVGRPTIERHRREGHRP